jgi:flagellar hook assembly protein FlgD
MTTIKYSVPVAQPIQLAVFDLRGQRVATLVDRLVPAGRHQVTWTGRDEFGRQVASGTYFYRLTAAGESFTSKMLLLK